MVTKTLKSLKLPKRVRAVLHPDFRSNLGPECALPIGTGWSVLVVHLLDELVAINARAPGSIQVVQIKEKFGTLRVYLARAHRAAIERIDAAGRVSASVCEGCGCVSTLQNRSGWMTTTCDSCFERLSHE